MLQPQRHLAGLLRRQLGCSRAHPVVRVTPAVACQPKVPAVWSDRSFCTGQWPNVRADGVVRCLGLVNGALQVASSEGAVYVFSSWQTVRLGVDGQMPIDTSGFNCFLPHRVAVNGDMLVGSANYGFALQLGRLLGNEVLPVRSISTSHIVEGFSLTDSHAYFCEGQAVSCLDMKTFKIHSVLGQPDAPGCGGTEEVASEWTKLLLNDPSDTAVVDSKLFVADSGNGRVLCLDMEQNKCLVVFKGKRPCRLAADHGGLFVYDEGQNQIFYVTMGTWAVSLELGTGIMGHSPEGLPPLATNLYRVPSMAIGHDRELVYLSDADDMVRGVSVPSLVTSSSPPQGHLCAAHVAMRDYSLDGENHYLDLAVQPTCGVEFVPFRNEPVQMFLSDTLPNNCIKVSVNFVLKPPAQGLGICLVPDTSEPLHKAVDCHIMSSPVWTKQTYVTTLSAMRDRALIEEQPLFWRKWKAAMNAVRKFVGGEEFPNARPFFLKNLNYFKVFVERTYDPDEDSSTWKVTKVMINGKDRAGALDPLTVGVDVPLKLCLFAAEEGGHLEFLGQPKAIQS